MTPTMMTQPYHDAITDASEAVGDVLLATAEGIVNAMFPGCAQSDHIYAVQRAIDEIAARVNQRLVTSND